MMWLGTALRRVPRVRYRRLTDGLGYVLVLRAKQHEELVATGKLLDLRIAEGFLRPFRQSSWLILDRAPILPDPNDLLEFVIPLDRQRYDTRRTVFDMFPKPTEDLAYKGLLSLPYVQIPTPYYTPSPERKPDDSDEAYFERVAFWKHGCAAERALPVAEYVAEEQEPGVVDHKWSDLTLYEPVAMRMWKGWHHELSTLHPGVSGDIATSTKITVAPGAWDLLHEHAGQSTLHWPDFVPQDVLFTQAALDHDKVIDHGPPYHGVWLHRDDELIIEHPVMANDDEMSVMAGVGYVLAVGGLRREPIQGQCSCSRPETHDQRVRAVLSMSDLVRSGLLTVLHHPRGIPDWYVLL